MQFHVEETNAGSLRQPGAALSRSAGIFCVHPRITDCKNCSRVQQASAARTETPRTSSEETGNTFPRLKNDLCLHCEEAAVNLHEEKQRHIFKPLRNIFRLSFTKQETDINSNKLIYL